MISEKIQSAFNEQIKHELDSDYLYLSMAAWFKSLGWDGMAHWMTLQAKEEYVHAMKFFDHINERGGRVTLLGLDKPKSEWASPLQAFQEAYKHEQQITARINNLVKLANEQGDYAAIPLLNWFVNEQIEEEASTSKAAQTLERVGTSGSGLVMLDKQFGKRE